jgi:uncharacterized membrane protein YadS
MSTNQESGGAAADTVSPIAPKSSWSDLWKHEDWWAVWLGGAILAVGAIIAWTARPSDWNEQLAQIDNAKASATSDAKEVQGREKQLVDALAKPMKSRLGKPKDWQQNPLDALIKSGEYNLLPQIVVVAAVCLVLFGIGAAVMGASPGRFAAAFAAVFLLAVLSYVLANHKVIKWANLEYPLWALLVGLIISNTVGTPRIFVPAVRTEFYIKTGLVLLGAEVLLTQLLKLGLPGILISWVVTPIVLISTYIFGQRVLRIESKTLNIVVAADMSVCGVSAAIATAAACRAKKEELSLAIGISLAFTVVMMVVMPKFIQIVGIPPAIGAAWIGGTIDATGAVAAAGEILGKEGLIVATTVKMIQNILIGVIAFAVAVYWVTYEERSAAGVRPSLWEIWYRLPKFIIGFVLASIVFSWVHRSVAGGEYLVKAVTDGCAKTLREWFFCLAFVSIGLETNFAELAKYLKGGKPVTLYVVGQAFSLVLSLAMCWLVLGVVFPHVVEQLTR